MVTMLLSSLSQSSLCYHFPASPKPYSSKTSACRALSLRRFSPRRQSISRRAQRSVCFFNDGEKSKAELQEKVHFSSSEVRKTSYLFKQKERVEMNSLRVDKSQRKPKQISVRELYFRKLDWSCEFWSSGTCHGNGKRFHWLRLLAD
jgi:hypothetical protein